MKKLLLIASLLVAASMLFCSCSLFGEERGPDLEFGEPPPKHKWVYTVSHFKEDGRLDRTYISDVLPRWKRGIWTVYDGMCVEYKISGHVEVYASAQYDYSVPGEVLPYPVCI